MKRRLVIELESESYLEEQFLIDRFPDAVWMVQGGATLFFIGLDEKDRVLQAITEWKVMEERGFKEET